MVGEHQVLAPGVQVEALAQVSERHGGTLNMPARPAGAEPSIPVVFPGLGSLPQGEVAGRILVVFVHIHPRAVADGGEILLRQLAVLRKPGNAEIPGAVRSLISKVLAASRSIRATICSIFSVARATISGRSQPRASRSWKKPRSYFSVYFSMACRRPRRCG
jgi:hypothetical protein